MGVRDLVLVLGDQLDPRSLALDGFDVLKDLVWMAELPEESEHVWSHKARIALFFSAMRHFAKGLEDRQMPVRYLRIGAHAYSGFADALSAEIAAERPDRIVVVQPGDYRVLAQLHGVASGAGLPLEVRRNRQFLIDLDEFQNWTNGRKELRLKHFYRYMRRRLDLLMDGKDPEGGAWNFDKENRKTFGRKGPGVVPLTAAFAPDALTRTAIADVEQHFPDHPGSLAHFDWPVTPQQAEEALEDFVMHRLPAFGPYQDALWTGETYMYHSRLSAAMNLGFLDPQAVVDAAVVAYRRGAAPLASVEGFVRQIVGWCEFVRGLYWTHMPDYLEANSLDAHQALPDFFWTGETDMRCLAETIGQTLEHGYAHHIQRLMITRPVRTAPRRRSAPSPRMVPGRLRGCGRMGRAAERPGDVPVRRWGADGVQALCGKRQVHSTHEQLLRALPLRPERGNRQVGLPVHDAILGFSDTPRGAIQGPPARGASMAQSKPARRGQTRGNPASGRGSQR